MTWPFTGSNKVTYDNTTRWYNLKISKKIATEWQCCKNGAWISLYKGQMFKPMERTRFPMIRKMMLKMIWRKKLVAMNRSILVSSETDLHESKEKWFLSVSRRFIPTLRNQTKKPTGAYYPKSKLMARSGQYYPTKKFTTNVVRFHDLVDTHPR